jgi:hypothetical protein
MLTAEQIAQNKETFLSLIDSIEREGVDKELLIKQLCGSDFFITPASTKFHSAYEGGLCAHSLNVYFTLCGMVASMFPGETTPYSDDTLKIVALFHDFDKMNKYEKTIANKKVYSETGTKYDEMGRFDWVSTVVYKTREYKDRFVMGTHGENSAYMTNTFIPLSREEYGAILNHHACYDNPQLPLSEIFRRNPLACLLHLADMASTYVVEVDE